MRDRGELREEADPERLATLTALQGGLLMTQVRRSTAPWKQHWTWPWTPSATPHDELAGSSGLRRAHQPFEQARHGRAWGGRTRNAGGRLLDGRTWDELRRRSVRLG
jgi:hypothetical protein